MIAANSWFLCTLLGLGAIAALALVGAGERRELFSPSNLISTFAFFLMAGLLVDHAIGLLSGSLAVQSGAGWLGAAAFLAGTVLTIRGIRQAPSSDFTFLDRLPQMAAAAAGFIVLVTLSAVLVAEPIVDWDARSIWFFHGKAIYFDGGLHDSAFWSNAEYNWSHKDYPKLSAMLAARYASFFGVWNEYAPKGALLPVAAAGILGLLAIVRRNALGVLIAFAVIALLGRHLWNGYQDGWIAIYGCVAIAAWTNWATRGDRTDLLLGSAALGVALCLKNEGQLIFVVALAVLAYGVHQRRASLRAFDFAAIVFLLPFLLWSWKKSQLGLVGDLESGSLLTRAVATVLAFPELWTKLAHLTQVTAQKTILLQVLVVFLILLWLASWPKRVALLGAAAVLYSLGIIGVYLGTPADFVWHVSTSLDRVLIFPTLLLFVGIVELLPETFRRTFSSPLPNQTSPL